MLIVILLIIAAFMPIRMSIAGEIHNMEVKVDFKVLIFFIIPIKGSIYNLKQSPFEFKIRVFGKTRDLTALLKKDLSPKTEEKIKRIKPFKKVIRYVKRIEFLGTIGIRSRPDLSSVVIGVFNDAFTSAVLPLGVERVRVCFLPAYDKDVFHLQTKCIISVNTVNIIKELINGFKEMKHE